MYYPLVLFSKLFCDKNNYGPACKIYFARFVTYVQNVLNVFFLYMNKTISMAKARDQEVLCNTKETVLAFPLSSTTSDNIGLLTRSAKL